MATSIAANAWVDPRAELDHDVEIGPFCTIGPDVKIGRGTRLLNNVTLMGRVTIGRDNQLYPNVVVGAEPQDIIIRAATLALKSAMATRCARESRSTGAAKRKTAITRLGDKNFLMGNSHVAHDCKLGSHIVIANGSLLAGHVHVHDHASISGGCAVHHFVTIGSYSFSGRFEPGAARCAPLHACGRNRRQAALHQHRGAEAEQFSRRNDRQLGGSPPLALSHESRPHPCSRNLAIQGSVDRRGRKSTRLCRWIRKKANMAGAGNFGGPHESFTISSCWSRPPRADSRSSGLCAPGIQLAAVVDPVGSCPQSRRRANSAPSPWPTTGNCLAGGRGDRSHADLQSLSGCQRAVAGRRACARRETDHHDRGRSRPTRETCQTSATGATGRPRRAFQPSLHLRFRKSSTIPSSSKPTA